ncbi:MAG TPA: recombinase family protein [Phycisphaerae bacterium]|jgi:DNA invertase Pin-like site-specific DNA recombinase|nr:recombinase family protein [Phycisphaerae bacterium]
MTMRAAIYARVSTADQHSEMQLSELREHADRRGWKIVGEYVDEGISGTKSSRPQLDKLMADARRRKFDLVCVWRFDRFARSTQHLLSALEEFRNLGVNFVSLNEAIDTSTPLGKMVFTVVAAVAELERTIIVERVKAGMARAKANGKRIGRPNGIKVDVKAVAGLMESGLSFRAVAKQLRVGVGTIQRAMDLYRKGGPETAPLVPMRTKPR